MYTQSRTNGYLPASAFTRKERMVIDDSGYYYKTREGEQIGPFPTQSCANFDLNIFIHVKAIELELSSIQSLKVA